MVGHDLVATNAHVVAGESNTMVYVGGTGYRATTVLFDPDFDLAILLSLIHISPPRPRPDAARRGGVAWKVGGTPRCDISGEGAEFG